MRHTSRQMYLQLIPRSSLSLPLTIVLLLPLTKETNIDTTEETLASPVDPLQNLGVLPVPTVTLEEDRMMIVLLDMKEGRELGRLTIAGYTHLL